MLDRGFSRYQSLLVALLALVQFTIILDFMIMSPLGAIIMPALNITAAQFGVAVSAYAFSAGFSGILAAGFADRFDRKRLLLFFYVGFTSARRSARWRRTIICCWLGRSSSGLFGGVMGSIVLAIVTDLFALHLRGRVMGFVQTAFAASQVLGIPGRPVSVHHWNWHVCFGALVGLSIAAMMPCLLVMRPVNGHLASQAGPQRVCASDRDRRPAALYAGVHGDDAAGDRRLHADAVRQRLHRHNLGIDIVHLPTIYLVSGLFSIFIGPLVGRASDSFRQVSDLCFRHALSRPPPPAAGSVLARLHHLHRQRGGAGAQLFASLARGRPRQGVRRDLGGDGADHRRRRGRDGRLRGADRRVGQGRRARPTASPRSSATCAKRHPSSVGS